ncbi:MAG: TolC family protein [Muribaculaceae bacterium]|nr:TolC family protein [Muribaculaceae bacterium]
MKRTIVIVSLLLAALAASAQMSLNDCLVYARDHAHRNIINRHEVEKARIDKRLAAADMMPYVSFSSSGTMSFGRNIDPETNTYDNKKTLSTGFGLQMSLPVFDGLVNVNNLKAARVAHLRQVKAAQAEEDQVSLAVIRAFYNVSYCKAMVGQMERQLERDSTDLRATERGEELGTKSGADVAEMRALVAADEYELSNQRNLLAKAYLTLRGEMGMEMTGEPLELTEADNCLPAGFEAVHPRIAEAEMALKESEYGLRAAKGAFSPRVSLSAGVSTSYYKMIGADIVAPDFGSQWRDNMGQYVGFSVSIPIFTGLSNINRVKRARIEVMESRTRLNQTRYEIEKETAEAALDLKAATDEHEAAEKRLAAEELAFKAMRRKFELGSASAIELYASSAKLATARANLEGKRIQKILSAIILGYYHGEKLIR